MLLDLHHVPGRLRVCLAMLKRNAPAARELPAALLAIRGVKSASVNSVTGSIILHYDRNSFDPAVFWAILHQLGYIDQPRAIPCPRPGKTIRKTSPARDMIVKALLETLLEQWLGPSAAALIIGALI
jgi:hypothetical protein